MEKILRNIPHSQAFSMADEIACLPGQIVSKTIAQNRHHTLTLFAFDQGEEISSHDSEGDAMVLALEGEGIITIDGKEYTLCAGQTIVMPATIAHAVRAATPFKMLLTVIFAD